MSVGQLFNGASGTFQTVVNGSSIVPLNRPTDRFPTTNWEARNGKEALNPTPDRITRPAAAPERDLQLAGMKLAEIEKVAIIQTLQEFGGNRTKAARALGISVRTLQRKLRTWGSASRSTVRDAPTDASS